MRPTWPGNDEIPDPRSWELYHENAKRGRRLGDSGAAPGGTDSPGVSPVPTPDSTGIRYPSAAVPIDLEPARGPSGPPREGALPLSSLSAIVRAADRVAGDPDSLEIMMYFNAVGALPVGLYHYRSASRSLIHLGQAHRDRNIMAAVGESRRSAAYLFVVGALENATEIAGERGYRQALIAAGRTALACETAAESAGIGCRAIDRFYDREVDTLLLLDGLSYSALCILALDLGPRDPGP